MYRNHEFFMTYFKENMTNGFGRKHKITFDINQLNEDVKTVNRDQPIFLGAFNNENKQSGVFQTIISKSKNPEEIKMSDTWGAQNMKKAINADEYIYTKESFQNSFEKTLLTYLDFQTDCLNWFRPPFSSIANLLGFFL